jgi:ATP-dependent helicase/DNAse subunit B
MKIGYISHSRLEVFDQCNYKYKLKYHDKIDLKEDKDYLEFGKFVHLAFELIVKENISPEEAAKKAYAEHYNFGSAHKEKIPRIFRNFSYLNESLKEIMKEDVEKEFRILIEDFEIYGFIDREITFENGKIMIIDYKTSKKKNELNLKQAMNNGQLMKYVFVCHKMTNVPVEDIYAMLFYVDSGAKHIVSFDHNKVYTHIQECLEKARNIKEMRPEQAKANIQPLCGWCEFKQICNPYQRSLKS